MATLKVVLLQSPPHLGTRPAPERAVGLSEGTSPNPSELVAVVVLAHLSRARRTVWATTAVEREESNQVSLAGVAARLAGSGGTALSGRAGTDSELHALVPLRSA